MNQPCLIKVLYKKFEESFASIDIELNLVVVQQQEKKIDVVSMETVLQEATHHQECQDFEPSFKAEFQKVSFGT